MVKHEIKDVLVNTERDDIAQDKQAQDKQAQQIPYWL